MLNSWKQIIEQESKKEYFSSIKKLLINYKTNYFPKKSDIFRAFNFFEINQTKIVIVGQDPYYLRDYANGLAFALNQHCQLSKSLINIFKEIKYEYGSIQTDQTLISWAKQGILLLNRSLTVVENKPNSHVSVGWETFTNNVIKIINDQCTNIVFMLWGSNAQSLAKFIDRSKHLIIATSHPSPLSFYLSFYKSNQFIKANNYLVSHNKKKIIW